VAKTERKIIFGTPENIAGSLLNSDIKLLTHLIQSLLILKRGYWIPNLTLKTAQSARSLPHFQKKLNISVYKYNFVRPHTALTEQDDDNEAPALAVAAEITDHPQLV
jgi:hypothetical protein